MHTVLTNKDKKSQIAALADEVKDFHPLLRSLFIKLPRITSVEYTHGPHERGADFVLARTDDVIGTTEYIGVVAKLGSLTQKFNDVAEQIDTCEVQRFTCNGKHVTYLDEIWVVTNDSITHGAQLRIHEKYRSNKVKFIQGTEIVDLVDKYIPQHWIVQSLPISEYIAHLLGDLDELDTRYSLMPQSSPRFHVDLFIREIDRGRRDSNKLREGLALLDVLSKNKCIVLEGESGSGKSQITRQTARFLATPEVYVRRHQLPFYISFQELYLKHEGKVSNYLLSESCAQILNNAGEGITPVVFVDGFDEVIDASRNPCNDLRAVIADILDNVSGLAVITTRPLYTVDYGAFPKSRVGAYEIEPLSLQQLVSFLKGLCKSSSMSDRLIEDIKDSDLMRQLPRNPISAILLGQLINDNAQDLPSNVTDVYQKFAELMLGKWDLGKGLQSQQEYEAANSIMTDMAKYFIDNNLPAIATSEALGFFERYLKRRNYAITPDQLFSKVISRSSIIQSDDLRGCVFFKHRSFTEFFYAKRLIRNGEPSNYDSRIFGVAWRNIYFFYVGMLKDCEQTLRSMAAVKPKDTNERFWRIVNMADYMLAAYATPYEVIEAILEAIVRESLSLYDDIISGKVDSPLSDMPVIAVLLFFEAVMASQYGYRFFEKAAQQAILNVASDRALSKDQSAHALFFLSVIHRALDRPNPFDGLIDDVGKSLPLPIQLALLCRADQSKFQSTTLRRHAKLVRKELSHNKELRTYAKKLMEIPVGKPHKK